jgi:hypothetical protein
LALEALQPINDVLGECFMSTRVCAKTLLPERFSLPFSSLHDEILRIADDNSIQRAAIAAPRGFGKTSLMNIAYPIKKILFREKNFIVPVSNTASQALLQSENIKRELLHNREIVSLFGPMKSETFSKEMWVTSSGIMVLPRGAGQQIRGILHDRHRPDLIILDDIEDAEAVRNEELRKKLKEWFFADVVNSVNRSSNDWKIVIIGTILHEDSLLANLLEDESWYSVQLSICDDDYKSNWPDFMSDKQVRQLAIDYQNKGMLDVFYREYRNIPIATEDATFKAEYFKYVDEVKAFGKGVENVIIVDPAKTVKLHSAYSCIVGISFDYSKGTITLVDCVNERLHPDELYNRAFEMAETLNVTAIGLEVTSLNEFITYPFLNQMRQKGKYYELVELKARASKEERIAAMVPFYRKGMVYHNRSVSGPLETQLLAFPRSRYWDVMDAFAYFVEMLDRGDRYFETPENSEDEFKELTYDEPLRFEHINLI